MEKFNLKKLNEVQVKQEYRVEVSNGFAIYMIIWSYDLILLYDVDMKRA
jgi:hypothetical protein